jgi:hypothetical protein
MLYATRKKREGNPYKMAKSLPVSFDFSDPPL